MKAKEAHLTQADLKQQLDYNGTTGEFTWKERPTENFATEAASKIWNKRFAGNVAGTISSGGYISISVNGRPYRAHRLAWLFVTGEWPEDDIDHKNGIRDDNSWSNLRPATRAENQQNRTKRVDNKSGYIGVTWYKPTGKWNAQIKVGGKKKSLGLHDHPEPAYEAYLAAKVNLHTFQPIPRAA
ncbi:hypothetical protein CU103_12440 [Phyllobacterium sophorae]|uniref:AP2/ERF domain-containing protein n=2 Tax=Phyllobacterium sophorae TaxID=1520277 RepID=A0A2P7BE98_9HYPH|nr:hypothetical protein CU103_12440 [Phyllobacterium sophorae]